MNAEQLLEAVDQVYQVNGSGYRPLPADIVKAGRLKRAEEAQKEDQAALEARQSVQERKAADEVQAVSAGALMGRVKDTPRLRAAREALQNCRGRRGCGPAIAEFNAAKAEAAGKKPKKAAA